ncbi:aminotransferase class III-fold pyridoxal phosphate-dependent enzyme [uncultured Megasphaera sp.]|uniref:aminotransferase class III-fold pyridoxal phosphate-dependent enzyme n=1 Tax=uncultured Megasphaera sp. TaxID=165188 RepID=UPI00262A11FD|nr:aminotransferase class III-fold pyridoxal phosphate-dependent enzyme [uncultured Megasphaera sp.]
MKQEECLKWVARDEKVISPCSHLSYFPLVVDSASGDIITDADGNQFIDFLTSASSLNLGSRHPVVIKAIEKQLEKCTQYTAAYTYNIPMIEYAERLTSVYPGGIEAKVCFGNCGSDGNDAAVKFARAYTGRSKIITFENSYHGNTYGSASLSACTTRMRNKMGPFLPGIYHFPFYGVSDALKENYVEEIETAFSTHLPPEEVAAVIIEPIQGDGGIHKARPEFIHQLYALCQKHGILFISEEVQQGFFRAGHWFSIEEFGVVPDGIIMGKSLGAGLTLGAFMGRKEIIDCLPAPAHLFTLGGNQIACAAGVAAFDYMKSQEFQDILHRNESLIEELSFALLHNPNHRCVNFVRGAGMSYAIAITHPDSDTPDLDGTFKIIYRCYEYGLLLITLAGNILRIQPPLTISEENLRKSYAIIDQAITDYENGMIPDDVLAYRNGW